MNKYSYQKTKVKLSNYEHSVTASMRLVTAPGRIVVPHFENKKSPRGDIISRIDAANTNRDLRNLWRGA